MTQPSPTLTISFVPSMRHLGQEDWNALAGESRPFMRWEWLALLEDSGAVCPETGWLPAHCAVHKEGRLVAAAPLYLKAHGQGEFVYDQMWADVAQRLGRPYYPKLVAVSPFTPVSDYSFLTQPGLSRCAASSAMLQAMARLAEANDLSSHHVLFAEPSFADELADAGFMAWEHQGFIWENRGFSDFEAFLAEFRSGQRKNIRRERRLLRDSGVRVTMVEGRDVPVSWFSLMYGFYEDTNDKFGEWGCKYLPEAFFTGLAASFRERLVFSAAFLPGQEEPVALALLVRGGDKLYGRYWGASQDIPFLHFELCYYAPIEWAIARELRLFDPGMGGEHKPRRGFCSRITRSLHRFRDPVLSEVFARNIPQLNAMTQDYIEGLDSLSAFKRTCRK